MLKNAYVLAKIGADTAENEQHFVEICQELATTLRGRARPLLLVDAADEHDDDVRLGLRAQLVHPPHAGVEGRGLRDLRRLALTHTCMGQG